MAKSDAKRSDVYRETTPNMFALQVNARVHGRPKSSGRSTSKYNEERAVVDDEKEE